MTDQQQSFPERVIQIYIERLGAITHELVVARAHAAQCADEAAQLRRELDAARATIAHLDAGIAETREDPSDD